MAVPQLKHRTLGGLTLIENEYWLCLEFRICEELMRTAEGRQLGLWCDGFEPMEYVPRGPGRHVNGRCWIGDGSGGQEKWRFKLLLKDHLSKREEIPWDTFLPPDNRTGWVRVDPHEKLLEIEPRAGRPAS